MSFYPQSTCQPLQLLGAIAQYEPLSSKPKPPTNAFFLEAAAILAKLKELHAAITPGSPGLPALFNTARTTTTTTRPKNDPLYDIFDMLNSLITKVPEYVAEKNNEIVSKMNEENMAMIDRIAFLLQLKPADLSAIGIDMGAVQSKGQEIIDYKNTNGYEKTIEHYSYKTLFDTMHNLEFGSTKELKSSACPGSMQRFIRIPPQFSP